MVAKATRDKSMTMNTSTAMKASVVDTKANMVVMKASMVVNTTEKTINMDIP